MVAIKAEPTQSFPGSPASARDALGGTGLGGFLNVLAMLAPPAAPVAGQPGLPSNIAEPAIAGAGLDGAVDAGQADPATPLPAVRGQVLAMPPRGMGRLGAARIGAAWLGAKAPDAPDSAGAPPFGVGGRAALFVSPGDTSQQDAAASGAAMVAGMAYAGAHVADAGPAVQPAPLPGEAPVTVPPAPERALAPRPGRGSGPATTGAGKMTVPSGSGGTRAASDSALVAAAGVGVAPRAADPVTPLAAVAPGQPPVPDGTSLPVDVASANRAQAAALVPALAAAPASMAAPAVRQATGVTLLPAGDNEPVDVVSGPATGAALPVTAPVAAVVVPSVDEAVDVAVPSAATVSAAGAADPWADPVPAGGALDRSVVPSVGSVVIGEAGPAPLVAPAAREVAAAAPSAEGRVSRSAVLETALPQISGARIPTPQVVTERPAAKDGVMQANATPHDTAGRSVMSAPVPHAVSPAIVAAAEPAPVVAQVAQRAAVSAIDAAASAPLADASQAVGLPAEVPGARAVAPVATGDAGVAGVAGVMQAVSQAPVPEARAPVTSVHTPPSDAPAAASAGSQIAQAMAQLRRPAGKDATLVVDLHPGSLGQVQVRVAQAGAGASRIEIAVAHEKTLALLQDGMGQLHRMLDSVGWIAPGRDITLQLLPAPRGADSGGASLGGSASDPGQGQSFASQGGRSVPAPGGGTDSLSDGGAAPPAPSRRHSAGLDITA